MISTKQAAERLHVAVRTIQHWLKTGKLKGKKFRDQWVISETEIKKREQKPTLEQPL